MIIETFDNQNDNKIQDYDMLVLEDLVDKYGHVEMFDKINEDYYYGGGGGFSRTGGSRVRGISGALQSIPSLLISTAICWPATLISAIGAIGNRMRKHFEDKHSWLNRLDPRFWNDYLGTYHEKESKENGSTSKNKDKSLLDRMANKIMGVGGAAVVGGAGLLAGKALSDKEKEAAVMALTKEDVINAAFVPYWVTLSNGEIIRVRASSPEDAKTFANIIIGYTEKPVYDEMNKLIKEGKPRYTFRFSDGEMCYWSAQTKEEAIKNALETRVELCEQMNKIMPDSVQIDKLEEPNIVGKVDVKKYALIPVPEKDKFISISTTQPEFYDNRKKKLPTPPYSYASMDQYRVWFSNFTINVPSPDIDCAKDIVRRMMRGNDAISDVYNRMAKKFEMYIATMNDGDVYYIPAKDVESVSDVAIKIYMSKVLSIQSVLTGEQKEQYNVFLTEFSDVLAGVKSVNPVRPKDYKLKSRDYIVIRKYDSGDGKWTQQEKFDI